MGIAKITGTVTGHKGKQKSVDSLVDGGATYSLLPESVWKKIGLKQKRKMSFILTDGSSIQRHVSECFISLPQGEGHTPVILGENGDQALLGVVTLEILGLVFNPFNRTLHPMQMMLA